jgi:hypothetical protein
MSSYPPNAPQPPFPGQPATPGQPRHAPVPPPAPPKKKGNLLLYFGGGCLLILVLALATCTIATRSCATFLRRNPDYVTKRLVEMANPDLEVVRIDRDAGIIKVYSRKEHKSLTLDLQDAKQGKIRIIGDNGDTVTLGGGHSGHGKIEVAGSNGKRAIVETNSSGGIKEDWIPKYPGASHTAGFNSTENGKAAGNYEFKTPDAPAQVLHYYESAFNSKRFKVNKAAVSEGETDGGVLTAENEGQTATVTIRRDGPQTSVVIAFREQ